MNAKYNIRLSECGTVEVTKPNSSIVIYKFLYKHLMCKIIDTPISNRFIVYILTGKDKEQKDVAYVGKSKNGLDNRPTAHEVDGINWQYCYVLTTFNERTFFNDGIIQYIENRVNGLFANNPFFRNTTKVTNAETITIGDAEDCDEYIAEALKMLHIVGLTFHASSDDVVLVEPVQTQQPSELGDIYDSFRHALEKGAQ